MITKYFCKCAQKWLPDLPVVGPWATVLSTLLKHYYNLPTEGSRCAGRHDKSASNWTGCTGEKVQRFS